jgi:small subunit ribosomal protein S5
MAEFRNTEEKKYEEKVLLIRRVSKKIPGGNYVTFSALVAVGDKKGKVGIGLGRGQEVPPAIQKAITFAKKHLINVPIKNKTLPHEIRLKYKASKILLKPAPEGTGLKVGSVARVLLDLAGVENASGKIIRSRNQVVNTYAIMKALEKFTIRDGTNFNRS